MSWNAAKRGVKYQSTLFPKQVAEPVEQAPSLEGMYEVRLLCLRQVQLFGLSRSKDLQNVT